MKKKLKNKKEKTQEEKVFLDEQLFSYIQPKGGVSFKEPSYILTGEGYVRCLHLFELPNSLDDRWLQDVFDIQDAICSIDMQTKDMAIVKKNINNSIAEETARYSDAKTHQDRYEAQKRYQELQQLYDEISRMGEVIKVVDVRIFVKAKTLQSLEEKCEEILNSLEGDSYRATTLLFEQKEEWQSLFSSSSSTHLRPFTMKGLNLTSKQLAIGLPFDYSELQDEQGTVLGFTETGGVVLFDEFTKTKKRLHYNTVVAGKMGSGKSTFLKKRFKHHASIGNFVRTFDVSGEFTDLTKEFGGKIIKCNGKEGMLNPLEILRSGDDDEISFAKHISKLQSFYKCIVPSLTDLELQALANQLRTFYEARNLVPTEDKQITGLKATEYPTLSDFEKFLDFYLQCVKEEDKNAVTDVETALNVENAKTINSILVTTRNLIKNFGYIFDGHTSIDDITNEKIVTFDITSIKGLGNVFAAQMQNLVSLCWDNAVKNGAKQKALWDAGEIQPEDVVKFYMIIDESHEWVNTNMPHILDMIITYMREARKYFAGITLASQSIRDYMPEETEGTDKIKMLFELSQYVFMFNQPSATLHHIRKVFGDSFTYSQIESIPTLEQGKCVLSIQGDRSIMFKVWLSMKYENQLFGGGR